MFALDLDVTLRQLGCSALDRCQFCRCDWVGRRSNWSYGVQFYKLGVNDTFVDTTDGNIDTDGDWHELAFALPLQSLKLVHVLGQLAID
jgi:hypothetical protein